MMCSAQVLTKPRNDDARQAANCSGISPGSSPTAPALRATMRDRQARYVHYAVGVCASLPRRPWHLLALSWPSIGTRWAPPDGELPVGPAKGTSRAVRSWCGARPPSLRLHTYFSVPVCVDGCMEEYLLHSPASPPLLYLPVQKLVCVLLAFRFSAVAELRGGVGTNSH